MLRAKKTSPFDALDGPQRRAATFGTVIEGKGVAAGPLLISAGAGTGKTFTLSHRIAHLTLNGVDPARILLLTFTRQAAQELIRRAQEIVADILADRGKPGDRSVVSRLIWSGTFQAVASRILRLFAKHLNLNPAFTLLDRTDAADLLDAIRRDLNFVTKEKRFPSKEACLAIYSYRVNRRLPLAQTLDRQFPWAKEWEQDLTHLYREYVERKQRNNLLDLDDLLLYWHAMMQNPTLAQGLARNFDHIIIDDYQDAGGLQVDIVRALKPDGQGVTVAGDDAQAIYPLRAPAADTVPGFASRFTPKADMILLAQNRRSTQHLLDCATALMAEGPREQRKTLMGTRPANQKPYLIGLDDATAEAEYIVNKVAATRDVGGALKRHAVLFRGLQHSGALEAELGRRNIAYVKYGDCGFLDAAHVKDVLSFLRWVENPRHALAGLRVLKLVPGIETTQAVRILESIRTNDFNLKSLSAYDAPHPFKMEWKQFCALVQKLVDAATPWRGQSKLVRDWYQPQLERIYESSWSRIDDLERLEQLSVRYASRERFLTEIALDPPPAGSHGSSTSAKDEDYVILSTIQAAKGQEWDFVYVLNVANGNFPSEPAAGKSQFLEEERRLLYVAMTRARNELHLCSPAKHMAAQEAARGSAAAPGVGSRFITERVLEHLERTTYRSLRGAENLRAGETASVDVAAQLKEMW